MNPLMATISTLVPSMENPPNSIVSKQPRKRRLWTEHETRSLMLGCIKHGVGNWKKILQDTEFYFDNRTSVDLKDRFRTICPKDEYKLLYTQQDTQPYYLAAGTNLAVAVPRKRRRIRRVFSEQEDQDLLRGVEMHGVSWSSIAKDPQLNLSHRRGVDLRDRLRNKYPDKYKALGFRLSPKKSQ
ncbi:hypothetical protein DM01DRAFT_1386020 [Hesseltinella vesiculosa]|uniref:Myb-like domain-containing protein n=1 Tax=Hesseltinella vesiculosa TaxID=101127 RepID=A0A1X2G7B9_9FUNG|nr:hypothetical protein DM01DRAFT_1386020 [Hesseltinella vesiculosa]